jgi:quercetin dioxygenase-like cupin family protein
MGLVKIDELAELQLAPGIRARAVTAGSVTVLHARVDAGAVLPEHSHHNEQVVNVLEGELELKVNGVTHSLVPGKVMVLEPNVPHSGRAVSDCYVVDVFHPVREDFRGTAFAGYAQESNS